MGRVLVPAIIENQYEVSQERRKPEEVRRIEIPDPTGQRLIGDPFHKGDNLIDIFS